MKEGGQNDAKALFFVIDSGSQSSYWTGRSFNQGSG